MRTEAARRLLEEVSRSPETFDLFQLLRRIDALHPGHPRLGESAHPSSDVLRIGQHPGMAFAPREIDGLDAGEGGAPARLRLLGFGLFGPGGPLPAHLTEYAFARQHQAGDAAFARFADIFHHRMASLFFRAWAEGEPTVSHDRPGEDRFAMQLGALAGFGMASLRGRDSVPDLAKLHFAGRFALHTRNAEGLEAILADFVAAPVRVREFAAHWIDLPPASRCRLGRDRATGELGGTVMLGARLRVHHLRFRLMIGPLDLVSYENLLPGSAGLATVADVIRNYLGDELDWRVTLMLHRDAVPATRLGRAGRLGWTSWIGRRRSPTHADDLTTAPRQPSTWSFP